MVPGPTLTQLKILYLIDVINTMSGETEAGSTASHREIAVLAQLKSPRSVTEALYALRRKGLLEERPTEWRALFLTTKGKLALEAYEPPTPRVKVITAYGELVAIREMSRDSGDIARSHARAIRDPKK